MSVEVKDIQAESSAFGKTSSYRSIFKATSLFWGVQMYQILIGIIKSKFIAVLLGPAGMGIQGLYQSTLDVIKSLTAFGLEQSAVRDISEANGSGNLESVYRTVAIVRRLVWLTGLLGLFVALVLSPLLSQWTFGNNDYTWGFVILSSTLLLNQLCSGQKVLLQGTRRLKDLAKASAIGSTIGLIVSVPLYYWIGVNGIVPTMVVISVSALLLTWFYSNKIPVEKRRITTREAISSGTSMIKMGIAMTIMSAYLFYFVMRYKAKYANYLFVCGMVFVMIMCGATVNPVRRGVGVIYDSTIIKEIQEINKNEKGIWITEEIGYPVANYVLMAGVPVINCTNTYPDIDRWKKIDKENKYEEAYNRYAHIGIKLRKNEKDYEEKFVLTGPDTFDVYLVVKELKELGVKYIFTIRQLEGFSTDNINFEKIYFYNNY